MNEIGTELLAKIQVTHLVSAFEYAFPENFEYEGEKHEGWEFVYVNSGRACITADKITYILKEGEMVCHKPMEFHSIKPYRENTSVTVFCFQCRNAEMSYFNNKIILLSPRQKQYIRDIAEKSGDVFLPKAPLEIVRDGKMDKRADSNRASEQFIKNTVELLILSLMDSASSDKNKRGEFYELITQRRTLTNDIIMYLHENIAEEITLDGISRRFSYSLSSIKRIFKEETGYGIIEYRNALRIERAKLMLDEPENSVATVSDKLGFSNVCYFSNCFKKATGITPSAYKKH